VILKISHGRTYELYGIAVLIFRLARSPLLIFFFGGGGGEGVSETVKYRTVVTNSRVTLVHGKVSLKKCKLDILRVAQYKVPP